MNSSWGEYRSLTGQPVALVTIGPMATEPTALDSLMGVQPFPVADVELFPVLPVVTSFSHEPFTRRIQKLNRETGHTGHNRVRARGASRNVEPASVVLSHSYVRLDPFPKHRNFDQTFSADLHFLLAMALRLQVLIEADRRPIPEHPAHHECVAPLLEQGYDVLKKLTPNSELLVRTQQVDRVKLCTRRQLWPAGPAEVGEPHHLSASRVRNEYRAFVGRTGQLLAPGRLPDRRR
jgi:hypothetical protein